MGIVTDGLVGYWHQTQGFNGSTWSNIAPESNEYTAQVNGAISQSKGIYFDGSDDLLTLVKNNTLNISEYTLEFYVTTENTQANGGLFEYTYGTGFYDRDYVNFQYSSLYMRSGNSTSGTISNVFYSTPVSEFRITIIRRTNEILFLFGDATPFKITHPAVNDFGDFKIMNGKGSFLKGYLHSVKLYHRALTDTEVTQNYENGISLGLESSPSSDIPIVTVLNQDRFTISQTFDIAIVKFKFDTDVDEWTVRCTGTSPDTGILCDSGGSVTAGTEILATIDYTELYQEGQNRINIYGKNSNGEWTPYDS